MFLEPDRPEITAGLPGRFGPAFDDGEGLFRVGVGAEVKIVTEPPEEGIADRATNEVQLVTGFGETAAELVGDRGNPQEFGDSVALGFG